MASAVIAHSEIERIKNTLLSEGERTVGARKTKQDLHTKSVTRAKSWTNTLEGSRKKKAQEKSRRFELAELDRQKVDAEEAKIQLDQRKATIDRANKLLYEESDRMKSFHSKMMHCDVLAEREAQVSLKNELTKLDHIREDRFLEMEKQNYRKMLEREIKEKETKEELSRIAAKAQGEQLSEYKDKRYREIEDQCLEGELLRRKAIEDLEAERKAEGKRRGMAVAAMEETNKANDYLKQIKAEDMLRQHREDEKIQDYAGRKEKMLELRKAKEQEVFDQKQATRLAMIDKQAQALAQMQSNEDERVDRQVKEKEVGDERKRVEKNAVRGRWQSDIQNSRVSQIERKRNEREREKVQDHETAKFLGEWCKVLDKQEQEEVEAKFQASKKLAEEHKKMVEIQRRQTQEESKQEKEVARRAKKAIEADTVEFHDYAENCIRDYADQGKNVVPLIKELREFRKKVLE